MLPETFYLTGAGWLGYFIYVPIALAIIGLLYWLLLRRIPVIVLRIVSLFIISVPLLTFPLWEALSISYEAEKLCKEKGGLHVYKTVEAEGLLGGWGIETASKYGFSFVESGGGKYMNRETMKDGEVIRESITEYKSRYQVQTGVDSKRIGHRFRRSSSRVIDRETTEVLGELVTIGIYPSRFDLIVLSLLPVEYDGWRCGDEAPEGQGRYVPWKKNRTYNFSDVIKATLIPIKQAEGEAQ